MTIESSKTDNHLACTVWMHPDLQERLDNQLSPGDGAAAIDEIFTELPKVHAATRPAGRRTKPRRSVRIYRGRFGWIDIGFSYIEFGGVLHIIDVWADEDWAKPGRSEVDCVLGTRTA